MSRRRVELYRRRFMRAMALSDELVDALAIANEQADADVICMRRAKRVIRGLCAELPDATVRRVLEAAQREEAAECAGCGAPLDSPPN